MKILTIALLIFSQQVYCQNLQLKNIETSADASFRGLSVVDNKIAWVSGTNGTVGRSIDGGNTWQFIHVKGFERNDFRSLYAFDSKTAIIANAGSPAYILQTNDGGMSWKMVYQNNDSAAFFDGIDFWNEKEGMIYGDPVKGHLLLLKTKDGGNSWEELPTESEPLLDSGEASFAASGTGIRCLKDNKIVITTGGVESGILMSNDKGNHWRFVSSPIMKGMNSTGIFSIACINNSNFVVVGGDYRNEMLSDDNVYIFYKNDDNFTWKRVSKPTRGYRECVEYIGDSSLIAVGPTGADISNSGGMNWKPFFDEKGFHVVRKARKGKLIILAGAKGKIAILQ